MNGRNKKKILIILIAVIIVIIGIVVTVLVINNNKKLNQSNEDIQQNIGEPVYDESNNDNIYSDNSIDNTTTDDEYTDFHRTDAWYNDPYTTGSATMPNLVGMNYADLREYLDTNNLYFITEIECKFDSPSLTGFAVPTKILSTIPEAGATLDPYTDTSITVLTESTYGVTGIELDLPYEDFVEDNFGKTMKVQFGNNGIIEGTIGEDFKKQSRSGHDYLRFTSGVSGNEYSYENFWSKYKEKAVSCIEEDEFTIEYGGSEGTIKNPYINAKIFVDDQLLKELKLLYNGYLVEEIYK